jgi:hypothetical protein
VHRAPAFCIFRVTVLILAREGTALWVYSVSKTLGIKVSGGADEFVASLTDKPI